MPKKPGGITNTRLHHDHFLAGPEEASIGKQAGKLPLTKEVLQYLFYRKNLPICKYKSAVLAISCPMKTGGKVANCENYPACQFPAECVVRKVKSDGNWLASGIPIVNDYSISRKIKVLHDEYKIIEKNKSNLNSDIKKREAFSSKLNSLFDISSPDAENKIEKDKIEKDRLRGEYARVEDITFLEDQRDLNRRKMIVGERDKKYDKLLSDKTARLLRTSRMTFKQTDDANNNKEDATSDYDTSEESDGG